MMTSNHHRHGRRRGIHLSIGLFVILASLERLRQQCVFVTTILNEQHEIHSLQQQQQQQQQQTLVQMNPTTTTTIVLNDHENDIHSNDDANSNALQTIASEATKGDNETTNDFNYTAYWQEAFQRALASLDTTTTTTHITNSGGDSSERRPPCPKVYIYDLPSNLRDSSSSSSVTRKGDGFGKKVLLTGADKSLFQGYLYNTNQYTLPSILEERLRKSKHCRTKNVNEADLFFVPVLTAPKGVDEWKAKCSNISGYDIVHALLPHFNGTNNNACRHFMAFGKGHYVSDYCPGWFSHPIADLRPFLRLAYSHRSFDKQLDGSHTAKQRNDTMHQSAYPNLFSVPYPSSLHFRSRDSHAMPQYANTTSNKRRTLLMSFVGKDNHGDVSVRKQIAKQCRQYHNKRICSYTNKYMTKYVTVKSAATFCLEPAGDSPWRKSLADSITFGCIPVLFSDLTDDVAPWFWRDWKARGRVLVPREAFVAGHIDLKRLLRSIPSQLLELMQTTLAQNARQFQYSVDDDQEDGIRVILDNLHREALDRERRGICGVQ